MGTLHIALTVTNEDQPIPDIPFEEIQYVGGGDFSSKVELAEWLQAIALGCNLLSRMSPLPAKDLLEFEFVQRANEISARTG